MCPIQISQPALRPSPLPKQSWILASLHTLSQNLNLASLMKSACARLSPIGSTPLHWTCQRTLSPNSRGGTHSRPTKLPTANKTKPQGCCLIRAGGHLSPHCTQKAYYQAELLQELAHMQVDEQRHTPAPAPCPSPPQVLPPAVPGSEMPFYLPSFLFFVLQDPTQILPFPWLLPIFFSILGLLTKNQTHSSTHC